MRPKAECAIDSEAMRAREIIIIIVLVKSKKYLSLVNFLPPKHTNMANGFRYKWVIKYSLVVAQPIRM